MKNKAIVKDDDLRTALALCGGSKSALAKSIGVDQNGIYKAIRGGTISPRLRYLLKQLLDNPHTAQQPTARKVNCPSETDNRFMAGVDAILARHGVSFAMVCGKNRSKIYSDARVEICVYLRSDLGWSFRRIGRLFGCSYKTIMSRVKGASVE